MKITKEIIETAISAYNDIRFFNRFLDKTGNEHWVNHIRAIENMLIKLGYETSEKNVADAITNYNTKRSPFRWDGIPWGEAGRKNHREAIKNVLRKLAPK